MDSTKRLEGVTLSRNPALALVALALVPSLSWAQGNPVGPEFRVNTYTTNSQRDPALASDDSGNFVVVWSSYIQDGSAYGVFGQRYDSSGMPLGPEFRVNTYTTSQQGGAAVDSDPSGNFIVVWLSAQAGFSAIRGQRYASTGAPLGPEFSVNTSTNFQAFPDVASDASSNFVVVWMSYTDGSGAGISGQRYASTGSPVGPVFRVNTYTTGIQNHPRVASDASGNFVVVWHGVPDSAFGVFGQRYSSTGVPLGPQFQVNTFTTASQIYPAVASDASGNFVVVWMSLSQDGSLNGIFGQRYNDTGVPQGPEFAVNSYTTNEQVGPDVASDALGNFVVTWSSYTQDGSGWGVFGRRYSNTGAPLGPEFRVNSHTTGYQVRGAVAANVAGNFVIIWGSQQDEPSGDVFGQRYNMIVPVELIHFGIE